MKKSRSISVISAAVFSFITLPSHAALVPVLGGQAYYDDQLDLTWTANTNINGRMSWFDATAWAASLTIDGVGGWRLPSMDVNGDGVIVACTADQEACKDNEFGHLYYYGAGTVFGNGITDSDPGPFSGLNLTSAFWSSTEYSVGLISLEAYIYDFTAILGGMRGPYFYRSKPIEFGGWAVQSGNIGAVPIPAAVWLFGSGLLGLIGVARRKKV